MGQDTLLQDLLRLFAAQATHQRRPEPAALERLAAASPAAWRGALQVLEDEHLSGLIGAAVSAAGVAPTLPGEAAGVLASAAAAARARNERRFDIYFAALRELREEGAEPTLLKSAAMAARFPALLLQNQMSDLDLYIAREQLPAFEAAVLRVGFEKADTTRDAVYYEHKDGELLLDVHHRFRLFEHLEYESLTRVEEMAVRKGETAKVLCPEATWVHLIYHLAGHRRPHGYRVRWLLDLLVLAAEDGPDMDAATLTACAPDRDGLFWSARLLGFFEQELGAVFEALPALPAATEGFDLAEVLSSHRHASFPLDQVRGWKFLIGCLLGLREKDDQKTYPRPLDVLRHRQYQRAEERVKQAWLREG